MCCLLSILAARAQDPLLDIMSKELKREFDVLSKADPPAYYIDYRVNDQQGFVIVSSFGSLLSSEPIRERVPFVRVRVGDYKRDNNHELEGFQGQGYYNPYATGGLPLENEYTPIAMELWQATEEGYKNASKAYERVVQAKDTSSLSDFSIEEPTVYEEPLPNNPGFNNELWESRLTELSAMFNEHEDIVEGIATLAYNKDRKYFVSTEGSRVVQNSSGAYLIISASIRANDGNIIPLYKTYFSFDLNKLPAQEALLQDVNALIDMLKKLKEAPLAEPYTGPALLAPEVAGVFFHEIFGHRIEGHRLRSKMDGQTFKEKVDDTVLPATFSVFSDPSLKQLNGKDLIGNYSYDDEGIKGQRVTIVDKGKLKTFLMSRSPLERFTRSNGHGRAQAGLSPVSRQSNLMVQSSAPISQEELRAQFIAECKKQGKAYGYYFAEVTGGYTFTDRYNTNSFNISPTVVYRIYVDGRPDELVRGVQLIGTPLAMFAEIAAASEETDTFTGICGAESGGVPVSATAPGLFVRRIETQKQVSNASNSLPLLKRPIEEKEH